MLGKGAEYIIPVTGDDPPQDPPTTGTDTQPNDPNAIKMKVLEDKVAELTRRSGGWQKAFQDEQLKAKTALDQLDLKLAAEADLSGKFEALNLNFTKTTEELTTKSKTLADIEAEHARLKIISTEYPELLGFYRDELLPPGTGDELREKLKKFSTQYASAAKSQQDADLSKKLENSSPPPPDPKGVRTTAIVWAEAQAAAKKNDKTEYDKLYDEFVKLGGKQ